MSIFTKINLEDYIERTKLQQHNLPLSLVFSEYEKAKVNECYNEILAVCDHALMREKELENKINSIDVVEATNA